MIPRRDGDITRVEAFSDAMIAFAATLLVVSLETPDNYDDLITNLYGFFPFGLSFGALFLIWIVHTTLFRRYQLADRPSILINGLLLFTVLFYVIPLKFLATSFVSIFTLRAGVNIRSFHELQMMFILYACGWIVVFVLFGWLYQRAYATRQALGLTKLEAHDAITYSLHYLGYALAGVVSILVALTGFGLKFGAPGLAYSTIGIFTAVNARMRRKSRVSLEAKDRAKLGRSGPPFAQGLIT